jgi:hypothetical protein
MFIHQCHLKASLLAHPPQSPCRVNQKKNDCHTQTNTCQPKKKCPAHLRQLIYANAQRQQKMGTVAPLSKKMNVKKEMRVTKVIRK